MPTQAVGAVRRSFSRAPRAKPSRVITADKAADLSKVQHTAADVQFMQGMIGHHAQALEMIGAACRREAASEDMRLLAQRIEVSQADEIKMMQRLAARSAARTLPEPHAHHAHGATLMPGMLHRRGNGRLAAAKGAEFDRLFLEGMIKHHDGALVMVRGLFATPGAGQESEIFAFASDVDADQRMEIERMGAMLSEGAVRNEIRGDARALSSSAVLLRACAPGTCAGTPAAATTDPRVGLKAGLARRGRRPRATWSSCASLPKPEGFFDPKAPAGTPTPPERDPNAAGRATIRRRRQAQAAGAADGRSAARRRGLSFANSDLAFSGNHLFVGNFNGFNIYDIENAKKPTLRRLGRVPGRPGRRVRARQPALHVGRADARPDRLRHAGRAGAGQRRAVPRRPHLRHQRLRKPKQVAAVQTCRGSHTHTLVADPKRHRPTSTSMDRARARSGPPRSSPAARGSIPRKIPTRRSSAST